MIHLLWFIATWVAGTAAILGSLMVLGSLILFVVPTPPRSRKPQQAPSENHLWPKQLQLLAISLAISLTGLGILIFMPFPSF